MSSFKLIAGSCADQEADVIVNAANDGLWAGGEPCGRDEYSKALEEMKKWS